MVKLQINMPTSCQNCKFKGARLCYIAVWLEMEYREVPEKDRPEWCPLSDLNDNSE